MSYDFRKICKMEFALEDFRRIKGRDLKGFKNLSFKMTLKIKI
jgi:hypothetical protein